MELRKYVAASVEAELVAITTVKAKTQLPPGGKAVVEETGMLMAPGVVVSAPTEHGPERTAGVIESRFFAARSAQNVPAANVLASVAGVAEVEAFVSEKVNFWPR
ncbi:hypothetical protein ITJ57_14975 [Plantibacter sp. VKM Ac-2880]|uniref:hypothetical protein n=1 Tax=Plantibacter sp. VKM Ac-2880 TaxID=2783827 RepID=UPI00188F5313|nr:hypothetical protein [Plantibacter sp. VKM Ac-2880]MBF4570072.1 hypothetical protein [Plantibacter sp. VKM Ac-2880]